LICACEKWKAISASCHAESQLQKNVAMTTSRCQRQTSAAAYVDCRPTVTPIMNTQPQFMNRNKNVLSVRNGTESLKSAALIKIKKIIIITLSHCVQRKVNLAVSFLADRKGAFGTLCRLSLSSVTFCIVAKWHILAKKCLKEQIVLPPETTRRYQFGPPIHPQRGIIMDKVVYFACFR